MNKKKILTLLLCGFAFNSLMAQQFSVDMTLNGVADGTKVVMKEACTHKVEPVFAQGIVKGGKLVLNGELGEPRMFAVQLDSVNGSFKIMIDGGDKMTVTSQVKLFERSGKRYSRFNDLSIKGGVADSLYGEKTKVLLALDEKQNAMFDKYKKLVSDLRAAAGKGDTALVNKMMASDQYKELLSDNEKLGVEAKAVVDGMITGNKDSWWGAFFLMDSSSYLSDKDAATFDALSPEAKNSYYGKLAYNEIHSTKLNKPIKMFDVVKEDGSKEPVKNYMVGKKYILIDFWASWCMPCRKEIPNLKKLYEQYKDSGFEIISISVDKKSEDWKKALNEEKLAWPNFIDKGDVIAKLYSIRFIPMMYLVDANGILVGENLRGEQLATKLKELMGK